MCSNCIFGLCVEISIHSLRMEGDLTRTCALQDNSVISIHSLRMEGDHRLIVGFQAYKVFQSTPSAWRETSNQKQHAFHFRISIHSLRMEGDSPA